MTPPSLTMIIYGLITETSIARLFAAGLLPGLLLGACYSAHIYMRCRFSPALAPPEVTDISWRQRLATLSDLAPVAFLIVLVLGGIYSGIATPSEAAALGVAGTLLITLNRHLEQSAIIVRGGVSGVIVRLESDDGLVGWGEACMNCDVATTAASVEAARPFVLGRDPWLTEAIMCDYFVHGGWQRQSMTGSFAFAGIGIALWDICGKAAGEPLYKLFGGALREEVDYFYYLAWGTDSELRAQCRDGRERGCSTFDFKAGVDLGSVPAHPADLAQCCGWQPANRGDAGRRHPGRAHSNCHRSALGANRGAEPRGRGGPRKTPDRARALPRRGRIPSLWRPLRQSSTAIRSMNSTNPREASHRGRLPTGPERVIAGCVALRHRPVRGKPRVQR